MCYLDLEPATFWEEWPAAARKRHLCDACSSIISPGQPYLRHRSLGADCRDRHWNHEKMCFPCWWVRQEFADAHGQSFWPSMLLEQLRDCVADDDDWRDHLAFLLRRTRAAERADEVDAGVRP
jgi:hypothetical protein